MAVSGKPHQLDPLPLPQWGLGSVSKATHIHHLHALCPSIQCSPPDTPSTMDRGVYNPCYTCRNRRIQCDQSGVPCGKCQKAGLECLDRRPFKWVKGVAIRGKLQGHMYENANSSSLIAKDKVAGRPNPKRALMRTSARCNGRFDSPGKVNVGLVSVPDARSSFVMLLESWIGRDLMCGMLTGTTSDSNSSLSSPDPSLVIQDPTFSTLDKTSKYYIDYCKSWELRLTYETAC